jgi:ADP-ribose pyrophosphatase
MSDTPEMIKAVEEIVAYEDEKNPWIKLYFDRVRFPNGAIGYYNRIVESGGKPGVAVLPLRDGAIGLLCQYRYPVHASLWEIPRGFGDLGVPESDAIRELEEETGIHIAPEELRSLGVVHPNSGILQSEVHLFAANCPSSAEQGISSNMPEGTLRWVQPDTVLAAIANGEITDSFTITAVTRALLLGILPGLESRPTSDRSLSRYECPQVPSE